MRSESKLSTNFGCPIWVPDFSEYMTVCTLCSQSTAPTDFTCNYKSSVLLQVRPQHLKPGTQKWESPDRCPSVKSLLYVNYSAFEAKEGKEFNSLRAAFNCFSPKALLLPVVLSHSLYKFLQEVRSVVLQTAALGTTSLWFFPRADKPCALDGAVLLWGKSSMGS